MSLITTDVQGHQVMIAKVEETGETDIELLMPMEALIPVWEQTLVGSESRWAFSQ